MSSKDASSGGGTSVVQHLELPSNLSRLGEWDSATVVPPGGCMCWCSTPSTLSVTKIAGASSLVASPLWHLYPKASPVTG